MLLSDRGARLLSCGLMLAASMTTHGQDSRKSEIFSRAAVLAEGVIPGSPAQPRVEVLSKSQGKNIGIAVAERVDELKAANVIRVQVVNPDRIAKPGEFPWMVAFEVWDQIRRSWVQFCGGTIVAPKVVLSAVHCNNFPLEFVRVVVQAVVLDGSNSIRYYRLATVETHPQFGRVVLKLSNGKTLKGLVNDFALFVLTDDPGVAPVPLTSAATKKDVFAFRAGSAIGWGVTSAGKTNPQLLVLDNLPIVDDLTCGQSYSPLQGSMLCAGMKKGGKDTCQGDSGGPLVVDNKSKGLLEQAGVISFGEGCGVPEFYGIYSAVTEGRTWIGQRLAVKR